MSLIKTVWETWWLQWTWPLKIVSVIVLIVALGFVIGFLKSCGRSTPKLNETEIQKGQQAVKEHNDEELRKILANNDVSQIDANVAAGRNATVNAIAESRKKYSEMNTSELQAEFDKRK